MTVEYASAIPVVRPYMTSGATTGTSVMHMYPRIIAANVNFQVKVNSSINTEKFRLADKKNLQ